MTASQILIVKYQSPAMAHYQQLFAVTAQVGVAGSR